MHLVLSLAPGGTERLVIEICRRLSGTTESVICCLDEAGQWAPELEGTEIPVVSLGRSPGFHPSLATRVARVMSALRIDVVHCHHYSPYVYGLLATTLTRGVRVVFTEHGRLSDAAPSRKRRLVNPMLSLLPATICAVSADLKRHMIAEGFPARRVEVLYNGIDPGRRPRLSQRHAVRDALGIPRDAFVVGTVGRLDPVKNLSVLLDAHAIILERLPEAFLVVVGAGPEGPALQAQARALGIASSVLFAGYRSDVRAQLAAFDVYVNSSLYEGVSLTILEAMAAVLPVVATRVGGNAEVVVDAQTGRLVDSSAGAIADAVIQLSQDPARRQAMGEAGRLRVKKHFSLDRMVEQYADAYRLQRQRGEGRAENTTDHLRAGAGEADHARAHCHPT